MKCIHLQDDDATALHLHAVLHRNKQMPETSVYERWTRIIHAVEQATTAESSLGGATVVVRDATASPAAPSCSCVTRRHDCEDWYNEGLGCAVCHAWMMEGGA